MEHLFSYMVLILASIYGIGVTGQEDCTGGLYHKVWKASDACYRAENSHPDFIMRGYQNVSGLDYLQIFTSYCQNQEAYVSCIHNKIQDNPCMQGSEEELVRWLAISNWICDGNDVRDVMQDLFEELPSVSLDRHGNVCLRRSFGTFWGCISSLPGNGPGAIKAVMANFLAAIPCTVKRLSRNCTKQEALLYALRDHKWIFFPPALGLNVSEALLDALD